jgi:hypothetical protein
VLALIVGGVVIWAVWPSSGGGTTVVPTSPEVSTSVVDSPTPTQSSTGDGTVPDSFGGTWKGTLKTSSGHWAVSITLAKGTTLGTTQYYQDGAAKCSGTLSVSSYSGGLLTLRESTPTCDESTSGYVTLSLTGNSVRYRWYGTKAKLDSDTTGYSGVLARQ